MANIPLYQQQQLASSRVGVPSMPEGGAIMAKNIISSTQQLSNAEMAAGGQAVANQLHIAGIDMGAAVQSMHAAAQGFNQSLAHMQEVAQYKQQAEDQQAKIAQRQQAELDKSDTENNIHNWTMAASKAMDAINSDMSIPPEQRPEILKNQLESLRKQYADKNITNQTVLQGFTKGTDNQIESGYAEALKQVAAYRTTESKNLKAVTEQNAIKNTHTIEDFTRQKAFWDTPDQQREFFKWHGRGAKTQQQVVETAAADNSVMYYINNGQASVALDLLHKGAYGNAFDEKQKHALIKTAQEQINDDNRTQELADKTLASAGKSSINDIFGAAITRHDATGYAGDIRKIESIVQAEEKKPEVGPNHRNENVINFGLERMEQLRKRKTDEGIALQQERQASAAERSAISAARQADAWDREDARRAKEAKIAEAPNQKILSDAQTEYKTANDIFKKESKAPYDTKVAAIDQARASNDAAHGKGLMSDAEWRERDSSLSSKLQDLQSQLSGKKPPQDGFAKWWRDTTGSAEQKYVDMLANGASPKVLQARGITNNPAKILAANSEHAYWMRRALSAFKDKNPGMQPTKEQLDNIEGVITQQMTVHH